MPTLYAEWTTPTPQPTYDFIIASRKRVNLRLQCFLQLAIKLAHPTFNFPFETILKLACLMHGTPIVAQPAIHGLVCYTLLIT
jgi:hypothetical protein